MSKERLVMAIGVLQEDTRQFRPYWETSDFGFVERVLSKLLEELDAEQHAEAQAEQQPEQEAVKR